MARQHNCAECRYLTHTSPAQVFHLCEFWAAEKSPVKGAFELYGTNYVTTHCHLQPEAPACPYFKPRKVRHGAASDSKPVRSRQPA